MERILVAVDQLHPQHEAMAHACSLAKRIQARLYVLFVHKKSCVVTTPHASAWNCSWDMPEQKEYTLNTQFLREDTRNQSYHSFRITE